MTYEELDEAILNLTGSADWKAFLAILEAEYAATQQNELEAPDWGEVKFQRGRRDALQFVANIRQVTQVLIEQAADIDADV